VRRIQIVGTPVISLPLVFMAASVLAAAQVGTNNTVLNANLASGDELQTVPHIDATIVQAIISGRPYLVATAFDATLRATSLSDQQRAEVRVKLFVPINLNTATEEEMMLVPGVGRRMAHEFDEYRPWEGGIVRFRREIGKYVDDDEVARLEQYVFVPMDLNTSSGEDFLTIPGVGSRMVHEFEEYRPYVNMAQFEREIGKYVDDDEVARLARYVYVGQ
jgi:DNA uptake protein ComE-like DNA-binding protein